MLTNQRQCNERPKETVSDWTEEEKDKGGDWPIVFSYIDQGCKIKVSLMKYITEGQ